MSSIEGQFAAATSLYQRSSGTVVCGCARMPAERFAQSSAWDAYSSVPMLGTIVRLEAIATALSFHRQQHSVADLFGRLAIKDSGKQGACLRASTPRAAASRRKLVSMPECALRSHRTLDGTCWGNLRLRGNVMNVRFKMTNKGEVAILPRKEFEALAAKAREADEDVGTARLVARAPGGRSLPAYRSFRKKLLTELSLVK